METGPKLDPMIEMALRSLHDIVMPQPVSWMPQTWGWWGLAAMVVLLLLFLSIRAINRYRANAYRRDALQRLTELEDGMAVAVSRGDVLRELAALLKRTALVAWPRAQVAGITGSEWAQFLNQSGGTGQNLALSLADLEYRGDAALVSLSGAEMERVLQAARQWIESHHVST
ncbi:DUF4381 family protein [Rhizobiales bacterium RZME27]|jgi:hypothetical protein|uniref:DUF4381 family protein n=1 Tax=Endobacterium cereale TaxID=2663029 RepID=A0A6A8AGW2_9HYPH|nr:DUF4381 domain-containing protein [Endobacterium cereale]MQY49020.1 DUF4381 family protein [Endobacterium cereale]